MSYCYELCVSYRCWWRCPVWRGKWLVMDLVRVSLAVLPLAISWQCICWLDCEKFTVASQMSTTKLLLQKSAFLTKIVQSTAGPHVKWKSLLLKSTLHLDLRIPKNYFNTHPEQAKVHTEWLCTGLAKLISWACLGGGKQGHQQFEAWLLPQCSWQAENRGQEKGSFVFQL